LLIGFALGLFCLVLALRDVSWAAVKGALTGIEGGWLALAIVGVILVALTKAERWRWLFFPHHQSIAPLDTLSIILQGQIVNILLPIRLGEVLRASLLVRRTNQGLAVTFGTILVEKLVDALVLGVAALLLGSTLISLTGRSGASVPFVLLALAAFIGLTLLLSRHRAILIRLERPLRRLPGGSWLADKLGSFSHSFGILQHRQAWQALIGWTALTWLLSVITILLTFMAFDLSVPPVAALLLVLIINLGLVLPAAPGLIGLIQYASVLVLTRFTVERGVAFAYGLVLHLVLVVPLVLLATWGWHRGRRAGPANTTRMTGDGTTS